MIRRRRDQQTTKRTPKLASGNFHEWVLSLPWVVERSSEIGEQGVRSFGVDCEPRGRRRLWLVTGLQHELDVDGVGLAVIVPSEAADDIEGAGWGQRMSPMPGGNEMVAVPADSLATTVGLEMLVLTAYGYAMS